MKEKSRQLVFVLSGWAVAIIMVLYFAFISPRPSSDEMRGTIGAAEKAKRHRTQQIAESDVKLKDPELQKILQSDKIQKLLNDDDFKQAFSRFGEDFRKSMEASKEDLKKIVISDDFRKAIQSEELREIVESEDFRKLVESDDFWWSHSTWLVWRGGW